MIMDMNMALRYMAMDMNPTLKYVAVDTNTKPSMFYKV